MNPLFFAYTIFETLGGLEVRPNSVLGISESKIQYLKGYIGKITQLNGGSSYAEYITGEDDTPILIGMSKDVLINNTLVTHTVAVKYYLLDGTTVLDISTNEDLSKIIGEFYGFNNSHPDYLL